MVSCQFVELTLGSKEKKEQLTLTPMRTNMITLDCRCYLDVMTTTPPVFKLQGCYRVECTKDPVTIQDLFTEGCYQPK